MERLRRPGLLSVLFALTAVTVTAVALATDPDVPPPSLASTETKVLPSAPGLPDGRLPVIFEPGPFELGQKDVGPTLDEVTRLGADTVRLNIRWSDAAPDPRPAGFDPVDSTDRNYDFTRYDRFIRAAAARKLKVLVTIAGPAPGWAAENGEPGVSTVENPRSGAFGDFVTALGSRYAGGFDPDGAGIDTPLPAVDVWSVWNEPNLSLFLGPQSVNGLPNSPFLYRELFLAAQRALAETDPGAPILIGETAPTGSSDSLDPIKFASGVLCLGDRANEQPACKTGSIAAAVWATHPYLSLDQKPFQRPDDTDFVTIGNLDRLESLLDRAARDGTVTPEMRVYMTEFGVQSVPDTLLGVPTEVQAAYLGLSERIAYADPRVGSYAQYLLRDDPPEQSDSGPVFSGFESGLRFFKGRPKPAYRAFRLPLSVQRDGDVVRIWGLVRPASGSTEVAIMVKDGEEGKARVLRKLTTDESGTFEISADDASGRMWQLSWVDSAGAHHVGAWVHAYAFRLLSDAREG